MTLSSVSVMANALGRVAPLKTKGRSWIASATAQACQVPTVSRMANQTMHKTVRIGELVGRIVTRIDGQFRGMEIRKQSFLRRSMY